jgi:hypothetical protein
MPADELPRKDRATYLTETTPFSEENSEPGRSVRAIKWYQPISDAVLPAAFDAWRKEGLEQVMVAEFVAPNSGELFLFVNDAIQVVPFLGPFDRFYGNNRGTAKVDLQHVPSPPLADK